MILLVSHVQRLLLVPLYLRRSEYIIYMISEIIAVKNDRSQSIKYSIIAKLGDFVSTKTTLSQHNNIDNIVCMNMMNAGPNYIG